MRPDERLKLARLAYARAISLMRARSTPSGWRRLLTAARNLADATRERDQIRWGTQLASPGRRIQPPPARRGGSLSTLHAPVRPPRRQAGAEGGASPGAPPSRRRAAAPVRDLDIERVWERSRALIEQARQLVAQARALRACVNLLEGSRSGRVGTE